ncbi:MauE/DoxX family redox-associated membrane protein [Desulfopila aestuarii]|uniref:Methylamine utilisation protein MauE n=1 Tax=Desulfopila aestuarii DSM 18488 TaxID=1121416 RepID=A0A1M7Y567_9BACT|nr:MauE/DoxX family redox-associated membrane protein [Desulfopila aestuarii]SHO47380.1 Methylamine utilisation protein MauE [Desulfopila aestuarii DSM 18488]
MEPKGSGSKRRTTWLDRGARWLLAGIFLYACLPKLLDPALFANVIAAYGLLPTFLLLPVAIVLPLVELLAALLLLMNRKAGLWLTAVLLGIFIAVLSYGIHLGLDIDCGCFSAEDPEHTAFSGLRTALIRDLLLLIPLTYGFWHSFSKLSTQHGEQR